MAVPKFSELFEDKLTEAQIDQFHEQQDLNQLITLAREYNARQTTLRGNQIDIEAIKDDKLKLIVSLWIRDITIPKYLNIGYGEPFDSTFKEWSVDDNPVMQPIENHVIYKLLNHPEHLFGFIVGALQVEDSDGVKQFRPDDVNYILGTLSKPAIVNIGKLDLIRQLMAMRPVELAYMLILLSESGIIGVAVSDYTDIF
jgi:hypothetical protein